MKQITEKFLLELVRANSEDDFRAALEGFVDKADLIDWPMLVESAFNPFLPMYLAIKALHCDIKIAGEIESKVQMKYLATAGKNEKIKKIIVELAQEFNKAKTDLLFIKGAALLTTVYAADIGLRPMEDIDVLIKQDDLSRAEGILTALGYKEDYEKLSSDYGFPYSRSFFKERHFHYVYYKNQIRLELHWDLMAENKSRSISIALFDASEKCRIDTTEIRVPSPAANIYLALLNFAQYFHDINGVTRVQWLKSKEDYRRLFYAALSFIYEIKIILNFYDNRVSLAGLFSLAESSKAEYDAFTLLWMAKKMGNVSISEPIVRQMKRNLFVNLYVTLCRKTAYDDFEKLSATRNLFRLFSRFTVRFGR